MENTADGLSSIADYSFSGSDEHSMTAEESGWTTYIDYFMETQGQKEASPSTNNGHTTSDEYGDEDGDDFDDDDDDDDEIGGSIAPDTDESRILVLAEPLEVSKRLNFENIRDGRRKKLLYDDSLEDTATSPISSPKLKVLSHLDVNHKKKEDASDEISHIAKVNKKGTDESDCNNNINNGGNTDQVMISEEDAYECNELRKKGLCLVHLSAFRT